MRAARGADADAAQRAGTAGADGAPLLAIEGLTVDFPAADGTATRAVDGVSFAIPRGRKFALVGESGSGKTVTALAVLRLLDGARIGGRIAFDGQDLAALPEREMRRVRGRDIAMVFQEPMTALNPLIPIGVQICESLEIHEGLSRAQARVRAVELLARTGIPEPERRFASYPFQLSGGQRQRAMIAVALACRPRLLIADEPTTALDVSLRRQIVELLDDLVREYGMSALLITHDLNLVRAFADHVGVMQKGRLVEQADTAELFARPRHPYTQRLLDSQPRRMVEPLAPDAPVLLDAQDVRCRFFFRKGWFGKRAFDAVHDASITLRRGETLGVVGESGSGKTTLGMALLRLSPARVDGQVRFDGTELATLRAEPLRRLRRRMQVVFQDPYSSLSPRRTVGQIVEEGLELHRPDLSAAQRRDEAAAALDEVGLSGAMMQRYPHEFSGGQRQRIAIARALVVRPDLLLLDEPTSALDVSVQKQVLELLAQLQRRYGLAYLFITHDLAVIRAMAHRLVVMQGGHVVEAGDTESVFERPGHEYTRRLLGATF